MSTAARHHYIPQFWLRQFATGKKRNRVWTYDKRRGRQELRSVRDVAQERKFYESQFLDPSPGTIERDIGVLESVAAPHFKRIVRTRSLCCLDEKGRNDVLDLLLVQLFRTKSARQFIRIGSRKLGLELSEEQIKWTAFKTLIVDSVGRYRDACQGHVLTLREAMRTERYIPRRPSSFHHETSAVRVRRVGGTSCPRNHIRSNLSTSDAVAAPRRTESSFREAGH